MSQEIVEGDDSTSIDGIQVVVLDKTKLSITNILSFKSSDGSPFSITYAIDGPVKSTGTIPTGIDSYEVPSVLTDGQYTVALTGLAMSKLYTKDVTKRVDTTGPIIGILTYTKGVNTVSVTFDPISDVSGVKTAVMTIKKGEDPAILESVDVKNKSDVTFSKLTHSTTYRVTLTCTDDLDNKSVWTGDTVTSTADTPTITFKRLYDVTTETVKAEFDLANANGGNLYVQAEFIDDADQLVGGTDLFTYTPTLYATTIDVPYNLPGGRYFPGDTLTVKITVTNGSGGVVVSSPKIVLPMPSLVTSFVPTDLKPTEFKFTYEIKDRMGYGLWTTAEMRRVTDDGFVEVKDVVDASGTMTFTGLTADTEYKIKYTVSGTAYQPTAFVVEQPTFRTRKHLVWEFTEKVAQTNRFDMKYKIDNVVDLASMSAALYTLADDVLVPFTNNPFTDPAGAITFTGLTAGTNYYAKFTADGVSSSTSVTTLAATVISGPVSLAGAVYTTDTPVDSYPPKNAFDDNEATFWHSSSSDPYIQVKLASPVRVATYKLRSRVEPQIGNTRNITSWTLQGSNDGASFTDIDVKDNENVGTTLASFTVASPNSYSYYRLRVRSITVESLANAAIATLSLFT